MTLGLGTSVCRPANLRVPEMPSGLGTSHVADEPEGSRNELRPGHFEKMFLGKSGLECPCCVPKSSENPISRGSGLKSKMLLFIFQRCSCDIRVVK